MIKGVKKSIIVVDPPKKSSFEKIFFVMKVKQASDRSDDMLIEANRIIGESLISRSGRRSGGRGRRQWIAFGAGVIAGAVLGILAVLLLS